jgi:NADH:ubiquinone oxidoreductase subunit 3 (subunit A)
MTSSRDSVNYKTVSPVNNNHNKSSVQYVLFVLLFIALIAAVIVLVIQLNEVNTLKEQNALLQATIEALQKQIMATPKP